MVHDILVTVTYVPLKSYLNECYINVRVLLKLSYLVSKKAKVLDKDREGRLCCENHIPSSKSSMISFIFFYKLHIFSQTIAEYSVV